MTPEKKKQLINNWQKVMNNFPYISIIPYPYCCLCFARLTHKNVSQDINKDGIEYIKDVCLECKDK